VATKIKLMRLGKMREPHYRIVVADARTKRDGRSIETIGEYHPKNDPSVIKVNGERAAYWLGVGAQPTETVAAILRVTGDWQKFKGEPAPAPMKVAPPKADKLDLFNAALADASGEPAVEATTPRKRAAKAATKAPEAPAADAAAVVTTAEAATAQPAVEASAQTQESVSAGPVTEQATEPTPSTGSDEPAES
jgi:small subunit ribosomal protein S16